MPPNSCIFFYINPSSVGGNSACSFQIVDFFSLILEIFDHVNRIITLCAGVSLKPTTIPLKKTRATGWSYQNQANEAGIPLAVDMGVTWDTRLRKTGAAIQIYSADGKNNLKSGQKTVRHKRR